MEGQVIYQLKAVRKNTKPPVWRRLLVPSNITFAQLAVILEALLELPQSDMFEFEFYKNKYKMIEWHKEDRVAYNYNYTYLNAPDTYINQWMENKAAFTFRMKDTDDDIPEYRIEIEKIHKRAKIVLENRKCEELFPFITKQVSEREDPFWSNPDAIDADMESRFFMRDGEPAYQTVSEILEQIDHHGGMTACTVMENRDIHTVKSLNDILAEGVKLINERYAAVRSAEAELMQTMQYQTEATVYPGITDAKINSRNQKCMLADVLNGSYEKRDLLEIAAEEKIKTTSRRRDKIAEEIARHLLDGKTMKAKFLNVREEGLDAFEKAIEKDEAFEPTDREWRALEDIIWMDYLAEYEDGTIRVPYDVALNYNALKKNGYREYHRKARWFLKCIDAAILLYMDAPLDVIYDMYNKSSGEKLSPDECRDILRSLPEEMTDCVIKGNRLIYKSVIEEDTYKQLEAAQRGSNFYIPDKDEIVTLSKYGYMASEKAYVELLSFFEKSSGYDRDYAEDLCRTVYSIFAGAGHVSDVMEVLNEEGFECRSEMQARIFAGLIMNANNDTRMAELKGHKPKEIFADNPRIYPMGNMVPMQKTEKKIYPNDPCPCGSGKKYKKCCGKNK